MVKVDVRVALLIAVSVYPAMVALKAKMVTLFEFPNMQHINSCALVAIFPAHRTRLSLCGLPYP